jgi:hypothetical protein
MRAWVGAANDWSVSAQAVVESSTGLATASRELADVLSPKPGDGDGRPPLTGELRRLAEVVESDSLELRDRYLTTAADIEAFSEFVD